MTTYSGWKEMGQDFNPFGSYGHTGQPRRFGKQLVVL